MIANIRSFKADIRTLLDIGCGIGAIGHDFLAEGASRVTFVDASEAYLAAARSEAERRQTIARVAFHRGDFIELASGISKADVTVLDRVICCHPDMVGLVSRAADRTIHLVGAVYPRDAWWVKLGTAVENAERRLRGSPFRAYVHAPAAIDAAFHQAGFARRRCERGAVWTVAVYERVA